MRIIVNEVQMISEAISSVINVDVTVIDQQLQRIAGTGRYKEQIGEQVAPNSVFGHSLKTGQSYIVENPKADMVCEQCEHHIKCDEHAEVCCPIFKNKKAVGVIGLIAFDAIQKQRLLANQNNLMIFLEKMAGLISAKLMEIEKTEEIKQLLQEIEVIVDSIENGIIATDNQGYIQHYNAKACHMFGIKGQAYLGHLISEILPEIEIGRCLCREKGLYNQSFHYKKKGIDLRGLYDAKALINEDQYFGILYVFSNVKEIIKRVNNLTLSAIEMTFEDIIGKSDCLEKIKREALKASESTSTVLIQGESGTGKELFARAIHFSSSRREKPFIPINCAAIPEQLLESELFGYESGAFTAAKKGGKSGKFELAHRGTIFLDEIGEMPLHLQSKLLRVLQEKVIEKVGSEDYIALDVRIIAATNKNLEESVKRGEFREDLYYRLNVIGLNIPPLRRRTEDLEALIPHILHKFNEKLEKNIMDLKPDCLQELKNYQWPGNVRELENTLEYAMNMCQGQYLSKADLPEKFKLAKKQGLSESDEIVPLKILEQRAIEKALQHYKHCDASMEMAAKHLGISRATLYRKVKEYEIK